MTMRYTVTVSPQPRHRGGGFRVCCFGLPDDNWNALASRVFEKTFRAEKAARKQAAELAKQWNAEVLP